MHRKLILNCILDLEQDKRDLFKVKLYIIRSKLKREREQDFKYLLTLILTGGHK